LGSWPREGTVMKWFLLGFDIAKFFILSISNFLPKDNYFPLPNDTNLKEIAENLTKVNEPSLFGRASNHKQFSYREIRSMYRSDIALIRLDIEADGSGTLTMKDVFHSELVENRQISISKEEGQRFLLLFANCHFMSTPTKICDSIDTDMITLISDGVFSIYEGAMDGNYHMFTRVEYDLTLTEDERFQEMRYYFDELCEPLL
jgi:hypothetical protein